MNEIKLDQKTNSHYCCLHFSRVFTMKTIEKTNLNLNTVNDNMNHIKVS